MTTALPLISDQSNIPVDSWGDFLRWSLVALTFLAACAGISRVIDRRVINRERRRIAAADLTARPALTSRLRPSDPVPAVHLAPALRVHLCTSCMSAPVNRPGETCYPYCVSVVHRAEEITKEASRGPERGRS